MYCANHTCGLDNQLVCPPDYNPHIGGRVVVIEHCLGWQVTRIHHPIGTALSDPGEYRKQYICSPQVSDLIPAHGVVNRILAQ